MNYMQLTIRSHKAVLFSGEVSSLLLPASSGIMEIRARHEASFAVLKAGVLRFVDKQGQVHEQAVRAGVVETAQSNTVVLLDEF